MRSNYRKLGAVSLAAAALLAVSTPVISAQKGSAHAGINAVLAEYLNQTPEAEKTEPEDSKAKETATVSKKAVSNEQNKQAKKEKAENICGYTNLGIADVDQYLNIREAASESSGIVGKLSAGAGCELLDTMDGWYHIRSGDVTGYVKSDYILTGEQAKELAGKLKQKIAIVNAQTVYIREKPNADCAILTIVTAGEELEIVQNAQSGSETNTSAAGETDTADTTDNINQTKRTDTAGQEDGAKQEWIEVRLDDEAGFVNASYVNISEELKKAVPYTEISGDDISDTRYHFVQTALSHVGGRYAAGGSTLAEGVDSAGFIMQLLAEEAIYLPHSARRQAGYGTSIDTSELLPGDLIFYGTGNTISHVAVYVGNGQIVHASNSRDGIKISDMFYRTPICCRRVL